MAYRYPALGRATYTCIISNLLLIVNSLPSLLITSKVFTPPTSFRYYYKTTYDLVSHGTSGQECYATTASGGAGYINSCIHSDSNGYSGGNTVWYNYVIASAGTIVNNSATDTTGNLNTATESVCPKGWTLPSKIQIDNQRNVASFSPVLGGNYSNGALFAETTLGPWWGSEAIDGDSRYYLRYDGSNLFTNNNDGRRRYGFYIRCVSEEKAITSLTYMQDMTSGS